MLLNFGSQTNVPEEHIWLGYMSFDCLSNTLPEKCSRMNYYYYFFYEGGKLFDRDYMSEECNDDRCFLQHLQSNEQFAAVLEINQIRTGYFIFPINTH